MNTITFNDYIITWLRGDITAQQVDAVVNAANSSLLGGGGVDGAIHRAGGPAILDECRAIRARQGGCAAGEAVITSGGALSARHVIHTVGPVWRGGDADEEATLARCYTRSLELAQTHGASSVAFPSISTGAYRFPFDRAAHIAVTTAHRWLAQHPGALHKVRFVLFSDADAARFDVIARGILET
jgi:O-acetyl-ADP-ribose deacetylase (regulator of RNase III)